MSRSTAIIQGMLAGTYGAGCMSVLRMGARRWGLIDATPPQATKAWLARRTGVEPEGPGVHHLLDTLVHLGVSAAGGALYGTLVDPPRRPSLAGGALFGVGMWAVAFGLVSPSLGITRSPRRSSAAENAVNVAAHALYGASLALVAGELGRQAAGARGTPGRPRARVG